MGLIDLQDDEEMFKDITAHCKPKDGSEFVYRNDDYWEEAVSSWVSARLQSLKWKEIEDKSRRVLILLAKSKNTQGCGVKAQKIMRKGSVQYSNIPELQGVDLDQYRDMPTESWRITLDE